MTVKLNPPADLNEIDGIRLATASAGLYANPRDDLVIIEIEAGSNVAAVFTRNRFSAAPVQVARSHLTKTDPRYLIINAGNANAGTGQAGLEDADKICQVVAEHASTDRENVLPFSTGVIGQRLPVNKIERCVPDCLRHLHEDRWLQAAQAIMTTDTVPKATSKKLVLKGKSVTITGMAKGSGMIKPDMATMLAFIATDAVIDKSTLHNLLSQGINKSFNRITVDGDTSTNDACVLIATGRSGVEIKPNAGETFDEFQAALFEVCQFLAQAIVRDGEGATKFVTVSVEKARTVEECLEVAYAIAHSPLVKTALFASDANWGRILAAIGRTDIDAIEINNVDIYINAVAIVKSGQIADSYTEQDGQQTMQQEEILIRVILNRGEVTEQVWTTDLSFEYVKINAEYRT